MEILWLAVSFIVGVLLAWFYFSHQRKKLLAEHEADLLWESRETEEALTFERKSHRATQQVLSETKEHHEEQLNQVQIEARVASEASRAQITDLQEHLRQLGAETKRLKAEFAAANVEAGTADQVCMDTADAGRDTEYAAGQMDVEDEPGTPTPNVANRVVPLQIEADLASRPSDDLTRIRGIGEVLEDKLIALGITSFQQIAEITPADIDRLNAVLKFPARIKRDQWVEQARGILLTSHQ